MRLARVAFAWALCGCLTSCDEAAPRTEVLVEVRADDAIRMAAESVTIEVLGGEAGGARSSMFLREFVLGSADVQWPVSVGVVPLRNDATRTFEVTAEARAGATVLARGRIIGGFLRAQTLRAQLYLWDACRDVPCMEDETCDRLGACGPARVDPCDYESLDGGPPACDHDGGPRPDAGPVTGFDCTYSVPASIAELNSDTQDCCASISGDGTTIYYSSAREGGPLRIWTATRSGPGSPFSAPVPLDVDDAAYPFSTSEPDISSDGLFLHFNNIQTLALLTAQREMPSDRFSAVLPPSGELTTLESPIGLDSTPDGLLLLTTVGPLTNRDLVLLSRPEGSMAFGNGRRLDELNTEEEDAFGTLTADGRGVYFHRGTAPDLEIWLATRANRTDLFGTLTRVSELSTAFGETDPELTSDGRELFFNSDRPGGLGGEDLYLVTRDCR